jgi:TolB-like protein
MQGQLAANIAEKPEAIERRRPSLPATLSALVMKCLEKRPADRPQTAADVVRALDEVKVTSDEIEPLNLMAALESTTVVARSEYYRNRGVAALAAIVLLIIGGGLYAWRNASRTEAVSTATAPKSIAVMPLENVGGDTAMQFFADGITDELTSTVSRLPGVQVTSRSATAAAVKADGRDVKKVGDRLHVGALLEGRMRRVGDRMRLTMSLTNVSSGVILWSDTYENEVKDAFQVQDSVARAIAGALRVTLGVNQLLAIRGTVSAKAHDLYLRGRFVQGRYTEPDLRRSLELFRAALAEDPNYAQAWSGIGNSWGRLSDDFVRPSDAVPRMRDAMAHGLAIDSTVPELRFGRGAVEYFFDRDPLAAQRDMVNALGANADLDYATVLYPQVLWTNALRDSAGAFLKHAVDRDPTSPEKLFDAWQYAQKNGNAREARDYCGRLRELGTSETCEALQDLDVGRADAALKIAERERLQATIRTPHADLAYLTALVAAKRNDDARKFIADIDTRALAPGQYIREDDIALMHGLIGDNDGAMKWYERALVSHSGGIGALYWRTMDNPIRKDPRLLALAKRAGLPSPPPYWP